MYLSAASMSLWLVMSTGSPQSAVSEIPTRPGHTQQLYCQATRKFINYKFYQNEIVLSGFFFLPFCLLRHCMSYVCHTLACACSKDRKAASPRCLLLCFTSVDVIKRRSSNHTQLQKVLLLRDSAEPVTHKSRVKSPF